MRFSLTIAACVVSVALLAGCSSQSQGSATMPGAGAAQSAGTPFSKPFTPNQKLKPMELLKLQAEGKIPGPSPVSVMKQIYKRIKTHGQMNLKVHRNVGTVAVWVADTYDDYIVGQKKNLTKTVADIPTYSNGCYYPVQLKVDHSQNLWAGCEDDASFNGGAVSEWNSAGSAVATYNTGCPANWDGCNGNYFYNYGSFASAADANHVFAAIEFAYGYDCVTTLNCTYTNAPGVEYWPAGNPSATPVFDALPYGPVDDVYYMDEDTSGNLWFTYYGCITNYYCGDGLGEISNPTSPSWTFTAIESPGTYCSAGGVYVSNGGTKLNVTDPCTRYTYQYNLPLSTGGAPSKTLGPTPTNAFGYGDPISGGFNANDSKIILSDSEGWLDRGIVSSNTWKAKAAVSVQNPQGAAFTPSDK